MYTCHSTQKTKSKNALSSDISWTYVLRIASLQQDVC